MMENIKQRLEDIISNQLDYIDKLEKERNQYKAAYHELNCYFDSISDEEQPKLAKRLKKIFKL